ncbi:hypothetical protein D0862_13271 [Hortaea werneckii]|uniref:RBR-type E3 ubiquitin transferase n=1 Tax=Hortaea werneckii TaxID=91943 RepID=A0A3M7ER57_HORWE|nr:hypothetical protein D0862_13271 [Hortaea werneckii]
MTGLKKLASTFGFGSTQPAIQSTGSTRNEERPAKQKKLTKSPKGTSKLQQHESNLETQSPPQVSSTQARLSMQDDEDQATIRSVSSYSIDEEIRELAELSGRYESIQTYVDASARKTEDRASSYSSLWNSSYVKIKDSPASVERDEAVHSESRPSSPGSGESLREFDPRTASNQPETSNVEAKSLSVAAKRPLVSSSIASRRWTNGKVPVRKYGLKQWEETNTALSAPGLLGFGSRPKERTVVGPASAAEPVHDGDRPITPPSLESKSTNATAKSGRWPLPEPQQSAAVHCESRDQAAPSQINGDRASSEAAPSKPVATFTANNSWANGMNNDAGEPSHRWKGKSPVIDQPEGHGEGAIYLRHLLARSASIERDIASQLLIDAYPSLHLREMHARIRLFQESAVRWQQEQDERQRVIARSERMAAERARLRDCVVCGDTKDPLDFPVKTATPGCGHPSRLCTQCLQSWIASELDSKGCEGIKCPECPQKLQHADVRQAASQETFKAYDTLATRNALSTLAEFAWCLNPQCGSGQLNIQNQNFMDCASCRFKQCLRHQVAWHMGETCEQYEYRSSGAKARADEAKTEATLKTMSKLCPNKNWGWRIEKTGGCEHMTCRRCRHEFCWQCMAAQSEIKRIGNEAHKSWCKFHSRNLEIAWPFNVH